MKIIYIANNWIEDGSSAVYATYNVWGMAAAGIETHLVVRNVSDGPTDKLLRSYFDLERPKHLHIHRIDKKLGKANLEFYWKAARLVNRLADEATAVISRTPKILPHLLWRKNRKYRIYYETHNFFQDLDRRDDLPRKNFSLRKTAMQERFAVGRLDGLICLTHTLEKLWREYVDVPIHVIYPGVRGPHADFPSSADHAISGETADSLFTGPAADKVNLAYTGTLNSVRGIRQMLEMAGCLPGNYKVYLFGGKKPSEMEHMRSDIREMGVEGRVEVTGWLPQSQLQERLGQMHAGLLPLKDNFFNRYLTAPSKFFDYLSHALPTIASSLPALDELVVENGVGISVNWNDPQQAAKKIAALIEDAGRYKQLRNNAFRFALEHTWKKRGQRIAAALFE